MTALEAYRAATGLTVEATAFSTAQKQFEAAVEAARSTSMPGTPRALAALYEFTVPKLSADGTCSLVEQLDPTPYDLSAALGGRLMETTLSLITLRSLIDAAAELLKVDWLGLYQVRPLPSGPALVKLSYVGAPSRAEFPLTPDFAKRSNNVTVALNKKALILADVQAHVAAGGAYYECDPKVRSEACLPLVSPQGAVVGIIDAEHSTISRFDGTAVAILTALAIEAVTHLPKVA